MGVFSSIKRVVVGIVILSSAILVTGAGTLTHAASSAGACFPVDCTPNPQPIQQMSFTLAQRLTHCSASGIWVTSFFQPDPSWGSERLRLTLTFSPNSTYTLVTGFYYPSGGILRLTGSRSQSGYVGLVQDNSPFSMNFSLGFWTDPSIFLYFGSGRAYAFYADTGYGVNPFMSQSSGWC